MLLLRISITEKVVYMWLTMSSNVTDLSVWFLPMFWSQKWHHFLSSTLVFAVSQKLPVPVHLPAFLVWKLPNTCCDGQMTALKTGNATKSFWLWHHALPRQLNVWLARGTCCIQSARNGMEGTRALKWQWAEAWGPQPTGSTQWQWQATVPCWPLIQQANDTPSSLTLTSGLQFLFSISTDYHNWPLSD